MDIRKILIMVIASLSGVAIVFLTIFGLYLLSDSYKNKQIPSNVEQIDYEEDVETQVEKDVFEEESKIVTEKDSSLVDDNEDSESQNIIEEIPLEEDIRMFIFLGIDKTDERDEFFSVYRSDTIAMLRLDMNSNWAKVLSIPRDTYAYLPVKDFMDKINHSYAYGSLNGRGEASVLEAVNLLIGDNTTRKYFALEMEPISRIVDSIGGVEIDVEIDIKGHGADIDKGLQVLYGEDAYDYIHWRYSWNGDIGRIERQQKFVEVLLEQMTSNYEIDELTKILLENADYYNTNIHVSELEDIVRTLSKVDDIEYYMIKGDSKKIDGIYYWIPFEDEKIEIINDFFMVPVDEERKE